MRRKPKRSCRMVDACIAGHFDWRLSRGEVTECGAKLSTTTYVAKRVNKSDPDLRRPRRAQLQLAECLHADTEDPSAKREGLPICSGANCPDRRGVRHRRRVRLNGERQCLGHNIIEHYG